MTTVRTTPIAFALVALAVLALTGCGSSSSSSTATADTSAGATSPPSTTTTTGPSSTTTGPVTTVPGQVDIVDYDFSPTTTTIKVGERVTWLNRDGVDHWVISAPGVPQPFDAGRQGSAASASHTFDTKGTYPYFCNLHNYMKGEVIVQ
ncbi:MAG: cupredoxin domain-containing protein [Acidimicrobiales bacterium]